MKPEAVESDAGIGSLRWLQRMTDALPVLVSYVDKDLRYRFNNRAYEEWFGHDRTEITGRHMSEVLGDEAFEQLKPQIERALAGERFSFESLIPYKDGGPRHVHIEYVPDKSPDGAVRGYFAMVQDLSARAEAEAALRRSEKRLKRVLETDAVGVIFFREDGTVIGANDAFLNMTGYTRDQVEAGELHWRTMTPDEWVAASEAEMAKLAATGRIGPYEKEYFKADGTRRWMLFAGRDLGDGTIAEYCIDISERRATEDSLRESEARFREVFANAGVGMIEIDAEWNILASNQSYWDITGREAGQLEGANCLSFTHPEDVQIGEKALRSLASGAESRASFEKRYLRPDGTTVWVRSHLSRVSNRGDANRFLKIVEDITEVRAAREELREETQNLEILNRVGSAIAAELDLENVVQMVTDAGVQLSGARFGAFFYNVIGESGESYMLYTLSGADRSQFDRFGMPRNTAVFDPTFSGTGVVRSDDITKDPRYGKNAPHRGMPKGHLPVVSYLAVPVVGRKGEVVGGLFFGHPEPGRFNERHERLLTGIAAQAAVAIDNAQLFREAQREIESRMKAEQAVRLLNETLESRVAEEIERRLESEDALRQLQKMETVGQLSGGIAHDFNNLLQVILGNLGLLKKSLGDSHEREKRWIDNAIVGSERAAALTQRLLAFSRQQPLAPRSIDVNELIESMMELLFRTLGETIDLRIELERGLWRTEVDPNQLENAILNLAINARDAMPDGGRMTIETRNIELDEAYAARNPGTSPGDFILICVSDEGPGMKPAVLSKAIEPFFTTKEVGKGTGLGLSMVYGFAQQSGGLFSLYSEVGRGTTAKIYLPRQTAGLSEEDAGQQAEADTPVAAGDGEVILLCEDDDEVRGFSSEALHQLGYEVIEVANAEEALRALREAERIDLLFTDVVLPGGTTGADLAREARKVKPQLRMLFTTGYARTALDHQGRIGADLDVILKPFAISELAARIRAALGKSAD